MRSRAVPLNSSSVWNSPLYIFLPLSLPLFKHTQSDEITSVSLLKSSNCKGKVGELSRTRMKQYYIIIFRLTAIVWLCRSHWEPSAVLLEILKWVEIWLLPDIWKPWVIFVNVKHGKLETGHNAFVSWQKRTLKMVQKNTSVKEKCDEKNWEIWTNGIRKWTQYRQTEQAENEWPARQLLGGSGLGETQRMWLIGRLDFLRVPEERLVTWRTRTIWHGLLRSPGIIIYFVKRR